MLNKLEREYVPYDVAKQYMQKLIFQLNDQRGKYVVTIRSLEDKYKKIEMEANGHFSAFVMRIKSQYAIKYDVMRKLLKSHKNETAMKKEEWQGVVSNLRGKNAKTPFFSLYFFRTGLRNFFCI